KHH
ncbi:50S ribosome-binding GTPase family protein, partial [Vibrio parahaemolyticus VP2007-007]